MLVRTAYAILQIIVGWCGEYASTAAVYKASDHDDFRRRIVSYIWGGLLVAVGTFLLVSAIRKREFVVYRLLVARSRILWKDHVHRFHKVAGVLVIVFGVLLMFGVIGK
jgi:hypothetical protein